MNPLSKAKMEPMVLVETWVSDSFGASSNSSSSNSSNSGCKREHFLIDVGCGKGKWAHDMAKASPNLNIIGVEIRKPAYDIAKHRFSDESTANNLVYLQGNINVDIRRILKDCVSYGAKTIDILIQFPDPHFKNKNMKRRVVNESFVDALSDLLPVNSKIFIQTDIEEVALDFLNKLLKKFKICSGYSKEALENNTSPYDPIRTERELNCLNEGLKIYRVLLEKI